MQGNGNEDPTPAFHLLVSIVGEDETRQYMQRIRDRGEA